MLKYFTSFAYIPLTLLNSGFLQHDSIRYQLIAKHHLMISQNTKCHFLMNVCFWILIFPTYKAINEADPQRCKSQKSIMLKFCWWRGEEYFSVLCIITFYILTLFQDDMNWWILSFVFFRTLSSLYYVKV